MLNMYECVCVGGAGYMYCVQSIHSFYIQQKRDTDNHQKDGNQQSVMLI